jgi:UDP-N-acetylmuramoyl-tripeptide--D-alanyl-D-alanine ligase
VKALERLSDVARRLDLRLAGKDAEFLRVVTDTRVLQRGDLFVALVGERFDGHEFVLRAASLGAVGAIVSQRADSVMPQIIVPDTLQALQQYAKSWRSDFHDLPVVGVTGSNGKTTTKQLLAAALASRGAVLATEGNLNNHIGVPITLLRLRRGHRAAVIEMGANHAGEIAALAALAQPTVGIVTQAGDAHLEGFGSREGVARAKGEMFAALGPKGTAIINADDAYADLWRGLAGRARVVTFGLTASADVHASDIQAGDDRTHFILHTPDGNAPVELALLGRHNVANALAASAAAWVVGVTPAAIATGLQQAGAVPGRLHWKSTWSGARLLDDTYNANPTSLGAALDLLSQVSGERWLALGDMAELGPQSEELHAAVGEQARRAGVSRLFAAGPLSALAARAFGEGAQHFASVQKLIDALQSELQVGTSLLVKGSRSARMDRVVAALADGETADGAH